MDSRLLGLGRRSERLSLGERDLARYPPGQQWVPGHWESTDEGSQWVAGYWTALEQANADFLPQPPDPLLESPGVAPNANNVYVPGTWVWQSRYLWRPGFWIPFRLGWVWIPAHYVWTPAGYIFVDGHWDYPFANRGLLFAPVVIARGYWNQPSWFYRPYYAVSDAFLLGCLFVQPRTTRYYFGDYFDPRYNRLGFVSWVDFRIGSQFYDPNLNYYRWQYRNNPSWMRDLRQVYVARQNGELPRPPRTLVAQNTFVQNNRNAIANNFQKINVSNVTNIANVTALASLTQVKEQGVALQKVTANDLSRARKGVQQFRNLAQERAKVEARVKSQGSPLAGGSAGRAVRVALPTLKTMSRSNTTVKGMPPLPSIPNPRAHEGAAERTGKLTELVNPRGTRTDGSQPRAEEEHPRKPSNKEPGHPAPEHPAKAEEHKPREEGKPKPAAEHKPGSPPPRGSETKKPEPKGPPPRQEPKKESQEHKPSKEKPPDK